MKKIVFTLSCLLALSPLVLNAQTGAPYIHDPSTLAECDGKYYTFGTGGGGLISDDGWSWHSGAERPGGGAAPDVVKIGNRYLVAYSSTGGGLGGRHSGRILTMWNKTLDPSSPDFRFTEPIEVAFSDGLEEDNDAIDAGLLLDPTTGRLWCSYGTYFGHIRIVELDPVTGARCAGNEPKDIAIDCEATDLIYRDGWYYLLGTHGTCCDGVNSTYNIVVGRSRSVTGPYLDNVGRDMLAGGGRMVIAAREGLAGAGHFGRTIVDEGVELMSCHFEADFARSGRSVLAILPLLWKNDWPIAGEPVTEGTYEITSERRGYSLELAVDFVRMQVPRMRFWVCVLATICPVLISAGPSLLFPRLAVTSPLLISRFVLREPIVHFVLLPKEKFPQCLISRVLQSSFGVSSSLPMELSASCLVRFLVQRVTILDTASIPSPTVLPHWHVTTSIPIIPSGI